MSDRWHVEILDSETGREACCAVAAPSREEAEVKGMNQLFHQNPFLRGREIAQLPQEAGLHVRAWLIYRRKAK